MAVFTKYWTNGDALTLTTGAGGISVESDPNLTGSNREMTIQVRTTNVGDKVTRDVLIKQEKYAVQQDGYWVHKDTGVKTYFDLTDPSIENGIMSSPSWKSNCSEVQIPSGVTGLGNNCFDGCSSLTSINIPEGVTSLGAYCFRNCTSLPSITLPESLNSLGNFCFRSCTSLTSITIPESVTSLGTYCFYGCTSLILATVLPAIPPSLGVLVFQNVSLSFNIKVRSPYVDTYKAATGWVDYAFKISAI